MTRAVFYLDLGPTDGSGRAVLAAVADAGPDRRGLEAGRALFLRRRSARRSRRNGGRLSRPGRPASGRTRPSGAMRAWSTAGRRCGLVACPGRRHPAF